MKYQKILSVIMILLTKNLMYPNSKTMFIPRIISTDSVFELAMNNYAFDTNKDYLKKLITLRPFYQKSQKPNHLSKFFLKNNKTSMHFQEDGQGDFNPLWVSSISKTDTFYSSVLTLCPIRTTIGGVATGFFDLSSYISHAWINFNTAFIYAKHNLQVKESGLENPGILRNYKNICEAFNISTWTAGKLACNNITALGLDNIQVKFGYDTLKNDEKSLSPYIVLVIPTGKTPNSCHLFEPLVGSKHAALGAGLNTNIPAGNHFSWMADLKYNYNFSAKERRSFDLTKNGDWSRYLAIVNEFEPYYSQPGINLFTQDIQVTPGHMAQFWTAFHFYKKNLHLETGYNFWIRSKEILQILKKDNLTLPYSQYPISIADFKSLAYPIQPATSASTAQIQQSVIGDNSIVSDTTFTPIRINDFNIHSAQNPRAFSHTLYLSLQYAVHDIPDILLELAGSYEFTNSCGATNQYAIWGSLSVNF